MTGEIRASERANFLAVALPVAILLGTAAGIWLPWETWRIGGATSLGDFAVVALLGVAVWHLLLGKRANWRRVTLAMGMIIGVLFLREVTWQIYPRALGVLYGIAIAVLAVRFLGLVGYQAYRARLSAGDLASEENLLGVALASLILIWFLVGLVAAL